MELFAAATGCTDPEIARLYLERAGNDVTRAVNHFLDSPLPSEAPRTEDAKASVEVNSIHSLMCPDIKRCASSTGTTSPARAGLKRPRDHNRRGVSTQQDVLRLRPRSPGSRSLDSGAVTSDTVVERLNWKGCNFELSGGPVNVADNDKPRQGDAGCTRDESAGVILVPPSAEWTEVANRCRRHGVQFDDHRFPPEPTSLDGRPGPGVTPSNKNPEVEKPDAEQKGVRCKCDMPARVITVSKAGPSQGRLFYGCINRKCNFFRWADDAPHTRRTLSLIWRRFSSPRFKLTLTAPGEQGRRRFKPQDIKQGAVGDCWFLAGLAVVSERSDLISRVVGCNPPLCDDVGCFEVNLFKDGGWERVLVDSWLPCKHPAGLKGKERGLDHLPAFAKASDNQIWPCIVEKAFAKQHGSYEAISGGHVCEAFEALTGAPTETVGLDDDDSEANWAKLLSFNQAEFPMGCATAWDPTRDLRNVGLVSTHAYSVLEVRELPVGVRGARQPTIRDWAGLGSAAAAVAKARQREGEEAWRPLRLVRVRNPWGKREWTGEWSDKSERWSVSLRQQLGWSQKNDGTFWMTWQDFMTRFQLVDVCKARRGWTHTSIASESLPRPDACRSFSVCPPSGEGSTWAYLSVVQPTKRGRKDSYWYRAFGLVLTEETCGETRKGCGVLVAACLGGANRSFSCEVFLEGGKSYTSTVLCLSGQGVGSGCPSSSAYHKFHFTVYSARPVQVFPVEKTSRSPAVVPVGPPLHQAVSHRWLETRVPRDVVGEGKDVVDSFALCLGAALAVVPSDGSALFFVLINDSLTAIGLQFSITSLEGASATGPSRSHKAGEMMHWECPPSTQKIMLILARTGDHGVFRHSFYYRLTFPVGPNTSGQSTMVPDFAGGGPSLARQRVTPSKRKVLDVSTGISSDEDCGNHSRSGGIGRELQVVTVDADSQEDAGIAGKPEIEAKPVARAASETGDSEAIRRCTTVADSSVDGRGTERTEGESETVRPAGNMAEKYSASQISTDGDGDSIKNASAEGRQGRQFGKLSTKGQHLPGNHEKMEECCFGGPFSPHPLQPGAQAIIRLGHEKNARCNGKPGAVLEGYGEGTVGAGGRGIGSSLTAY